MTIKNLTLLFITGLFLFGTSVFAQTTLSPVDKQQITENLNTLVRAVNTGDIQKISALIGTDNQT